MRSSTLCVGLAATLAHGATLITRAAIDRCLIDAGVPVDVNGTADYARDSAPFNIRVPFTPVAIAVPTTIPQIQKAVICGKKLKVKVSAKSGGHSYGSYGFGGEDGHLVVQLDRMFNVTVDDATGIATSQPGVRLGHLATVLNAHGRAISHGTCPGVGIGGHFSHGGFGFSSHMHGLAVDSIIGATVVLADGTLRTATASQNADLFWAIKGAASNFGIVVEWKLATFPVPTSLTRFSVSLAWNRTTAIPGLLAVEQFIKNDIPREMNFRVADYGHGTPGIEGLFYGSETQLRAAIAPLLADLGSLATLSDVEPISWIDVQIRYSNAADGNIDQYLPSTQENFYAKSLYLRGLNGTSLENFVNYWWDANESLGPERQYWFQLDVHGGASSQIAAVSNSATSYGHRDFLYLIQLYDRVAEGVFDPAWLAFLNGWVATTVAPVGDDYGMYINYADTELTRAEAQKRWYGPNLRKLQKIKAKYDPEERFYYPQSIQPIA